MLLVYSTGEDYQNHCPAGIVWYSTKIMTQPNNPRVRPASHADFPDIMRIKADPAGVDTETELLFRERIPQTVIVESGGLAVAYAIWKDEAWTDGQGPPKHTRTLTDVHVHEDYRRAGFGKLAVEGAAWVLLDDAAAGRHPDRVLMASAAGHNTAGGDFLDAIDFRHAGSVYFPGDGMAQTERDFYFRDLEQLPPALESLPEGMTAPMSWGSTNLGTGPTPIPTSIRANPEWIA